MHDVVLKRQVVVESLNNMRIMIPNMLFLFLFSLRRLCVGSALFVNSGYGLEKCKVGYQTFYLRNNYFMISLKGHSRCSEAAGLETEHWNFCLSFH